MKLKKGIAIVLVMSCFAAFFGGCKKIAGNLGADQPTNAPTKEGKKNTEKTPRAFVEEDETEGLLRKAGSYEEISEALKKVTARDALLRGSSSGLFDVSIASEKATTINGSSYNDSKEPFVVPEYSKTNTQVEGIDEADIIKTDGKYLYVFNESFNEIYIVEAGKEALTKCSTIHVKKTEAGFGSEMYLLKDRLVLITRDDQERNKTYLLTKGSNKTHLLTYDISDRTNPVLLSDLSQDGNLISSRCTGGKVYLFTSFNEYSQTIQQETLPKVGKETIPAEGFYLCDKPFTTNFMILSSMSPEQPDAFYDTKSLLASGEHCYVSEKYVYLCSDRWPSQQYPYERTEIYRFRYEEGEILPAGQVTVKGTLNNQFSMDEYKGNLRVVTSVEEYTYEYERLKEELVDVTRDGVIDNDDLDYAFRFFYVGDTKQSNALYIYDDELTLTGKIENIAPTEHIESARLMGDIGYFVTFRQTDPLFSVDLSDPKNPKILGELKLPGFSEYLHPYGEGLLLGIGFAADEQTGRTECLKLSMFDITDPSNVTESHSLRLTKYNYSGSTINHKAILADVAKNLIGLPARGSDANGVRNSFLLYGYDKENGFYQKMENTYEAFKEQQNDDIYQHFYEEQRGVYIQDVLYVVMPNLEIRSFRMSDYEKLSQLSLR